MSDKKEDNCSPRPDDAAAPERQNMDLPEQKTGQDTAHVPNNGPCSDAGSKIASDPAVYSLGDAVSAWRVSAGGTPGIDDAATARPEQAKARSGDSVGQFGEQGSSGRSSRPENSGQPGQEPGRTASTQWSKAAANIKASGREAGNRPDASLPGGGNIPPGGAWVWLPEGIKKKPWRKRHPVLFWGGVVFLLTLFFAWGRLSGDDSPIGGPKIAVINVNGIILDAEEVVTFMEKVRKDKKFKGAVLRINSPGGAVGPSQEIYQAAKRLAAEKPLVASMGTVAASGGYYAALGAGRIIAGPSTLTASIGVKMQVANIENLMRTIGVSEKTLTTGRLKDAGSAWRTMSEEEETYFKALLADMYDEFIATVAKERDMPLEDVRAVADGRAMTGRQALAARLVDDLGDMHEAIDMVKNASGLGSTQVRIVTGPEKPKTSFISDLLKSTVRGVLDERGTMEQPTFFY